MQSLANMTSLPDACSLRLLAYRDILPTLDSPTPLHALYLINTLKFWFVVAALAEPQLHRMCVCVSVFYPHCPSQGFRIQTMQDKETNHITIFVQFPLLLHKNPYKEVPRLPPLLESLLTPRSYPFFPLTNLDSQDCPYLSSSLI